LWEKLSLNGARMSKIALEGGKTALWEGWKVNGYVSDLLCYNSTQRDLSHAGL